MANQSQLEERVQKSISLESENICLKNELQRMQQSKDEVKQNINELTAKDSVFMSFRCTCDASSNKKNNNFTQDCEQDIAVLLSKLTETRKQLEEEKNVNQEATKIMREYRREIDEKLNKLKDKMVRLSVN